MDERRLPINYNAYLESLSMEIYNGEVTNLFIYNLNWSEYKAKGRSDEARKKIKSANTIEILYINEYTVNGYYANATVEGVDWNLATKTPETFSTSILFKSYDIENRSSALYRTIGEFKTNFRNNITGISAPRFDLLKRKVLAEQFSFVKVRKVNRMNYTQYAEISETAGKMSLGKLYYMDEIYARSDELLLLNTITRQNIEVSWVRLSNSKTEQSNGYETSHVE